MWSSKLCSMEKRWLRREVPIPSWVNDGPGRSRANRRNMQVVPWSDHKSTAPHVLLRKLRASVPHPVVCLVKYRHHRS